jgi:ATP-dependent exoDNAse (exonuclease V) alpha subunit
MAIYHLSVKPVSRGSGRSATAASAYRSASRILDESSGEVFDYLRKRGVEYAEIVLPNDASSDVHCWARDRERLWNAAECAESRRDARVAREYEVALPHELTRLQRVELTRAFAAELAARYGCAVDFAIHRPHREGDERNFHAHILATTRRIQASGLGAKTAIEWSDRERAKQQLPPAKVEVKAIRERWRDLVNEHLAARGHASRIDHRTLEAQGIDREPTVHLGPVVAERQRRGKSSTVLDRIQADRARDAGERLARAAELGRIEREAEGLRQSILVLDADLKAARLERWASGAVEPKPSAAGLTLDLSGDVRRAAQDRWLARREGGREVRRDPGQESQRESAREAARAPTGDGQGIVLPD